MIVSRVIIVFCAFVIVLAATQKNTSLELVHVFFRHGDRTPDKKDFYPTDPYRNYSFYPVGLGQLTDKGKTREYNLGSMLRSRYNDFLGKIYTPEVLLAASTDYDRTKMSLLLVLAGLWPPAPAQQWNSHLSWQPIPITYKSSDQDFTIQRPNSYCPKYLNELEQVENSDEYQQFVQKNRGVFDFVEKRTGKPMKKVIDVFNVYQNLNAEDSLNLTLPDWTKVMYPEPLHHIAGMQCYFENCNDVLIRLNGGRQLQKVVNDGRLKISGELTPAGRKLYLVSGHENNVVNVLSALGVFTPHVPRYGSAVLVELHRALDSGEYGYKIYHHNQETSEPKLVTVPGCTEFCPFDKFLSITAKYIPGNYTAECQSTINLN